MDKRVILMVDNDIEALSAGKAFLEGAGYEVRYATDFETGLESVKNTSPDCIMLGAYISGEKGFCACKKYRIITKAPILFFSKEIPEEEKIECFNAGADDFILKECGLKEVEARISANIRRRKEYDPVERRCYGHLSIDYFRHRVYCDDEEIFLSNKEYELLMLFEKNNDETVSFEMIYSTMLGNKTKFDKNASIVFVNRLKKKLEAFPELKGVIRNIRYEGYKFCAR